MTSTAAKHPAPYSPEVLDVLSALITDIAAGRVNRHPKLGALPIEPIRHVHDPFAGEGARLGALCDALGVTFSGTELEAPFIIDPRVKHGNSTKRGTYPRRRHVIVTSPVYPNGVADHFEARDTCRVCKGTGRKPVVGGMVQVDATHLVPQRYVTADEWVCGPCHGTGRRSHRRRTYRAARAAITGSDAPLHADNQGRWGYRGTPLHAPARAMYWNIARKVVACWNADVAFVNVSDFTVQGTIEPVTALWCQVLIEHGYTLARVVPVRTRRWRDGANRDERVEAEQIIVAVRP